jgi:nicotinate-nucleotide adenylyltransferase
MRLGLFGGTFDPIHVGHLDVARAAAAALALERVWVVPSRTPPHRSRPRASAAHRFAMAALAVQHDPVLLVSDLEMETPGPSYTVDTLDRLQHSRVDLAGVFFITGADAFREIGAWKDYPAVLDRCHFAVVSRPGAPAGDLRRVLPVLAERMEPVPGDVPARPSILLVDAPTAAVSSTAVREARASGRRLTGLVVPPVEQYILEHDLYRVDGTSPSSEGAA